MLSQDMNEKQFSLNDLQKILSRFQQIDPSMVYKTGIIKYRHGVSYNEFGKIDLREVLLKSRLELALEFCSLDELQVAEFDTTKWIVVDLVGDAFIYNDLDHILAEDREGDTIYQWNEDLWQWQKMKLVKKIVKDLEVL